MSRNLNAYISKSAIKHNLTVIKQHAVNAKVMAMIKANGYGHGLAFVAKALEKADALGVASIEEALLLRQAGIQQTIVLMEGFFHQDELATIAQHQFVLVLHHPYQLDALVHYAGQSQHPFKVWVKVNLGMNRLGFESTHLSEVLSALNAAKHIECIGLMGHFPQADATDSNVTTEQCEHFTKLCESVPGEHSLANSAGILHWPQSHFNWVRPGLALYGAAPFAGKTGAEYNLQPAMRLTSEVISIREVAPHAKVGYGGTWQNGDYPRTIAIVAAGYGDGYPWHAKSGTPVKVDSQRAYTVGRVSMDMLAIDVTHIKNIQIGAQVTLWGQDLPIEEVAFGAHTIPYELFCRLTSRVKLHLVE